MANAQHSIALPLNVQHLCCCRALAPPIQKEHRACLHLTDTGQEVCVKYMSALLQQPV